MAIKRMLVLFLLLPLGIALNSAYALENKLPRKGHVDSATSIGGRVNVAQPLPDQYEWWRPNDIDGKLLPIYSDPWLIKDSQAEMTFTDKAAGLSWYKPKFLKVQDSVSLPTAEYLCKQVFVNYHVPTRHEMESILDYRRSNPVIDTSFMEGATSTDYWTSTPSRLASGRNNWVFNLTDGRVFERDSKSELTKANFFCVSDMKGPPPTTHYVETNGMIQDNATGLLWQKNTVLANDFQELADKCTTSKINATQWRVPTWKELSTLLSASQMQPYIDPVFLGQLQLDSSTPVATGTSRVFKGVDFQTGLITTGEGMATRCVALSSDHPLPLNRTYKGNVYISGPGYTTGNQKLQEFENGQYRVIEGDLIVDQLNSASLVLPYLEKITGSLIISYSRLELVRMPSLTSIGKDLFIESNDRLKMLGFPALDSVGISLSIARNTNLGVDQDSHDNGRFGAPIDLRSLTKIGRNFDVQVNPQLKAFSIPRLETIGGRLVVDQNNSMWVFEFSTLSAIGTECKDSSDFCGSLSVQNNVQLKHIATPLLQSVLTDFYLSGNPVLESFSERLQNVGGTFRGVWNKQLCASDTLDVMLSRMWNNNKFPAVIEIHGNKPDLACKTRCADRDHCSIPH